MLEVDGEPTRAGGFRCQATIANHVFDPSLNHFFTILWPVSAEDALLSALERELEL
jgi:hypothetical protein